MGGRSVVSSLMVLGSVGRGRTGTSSDQNRERERRTEDPETVDERRW